MGCAYTHPHGYNPGIYNNMMPGGMHMQWGHPKFKNMKMEMRKPSGPGQNSNNKFSKCLDHKNQARESDNPDQPLPENTQEFVEINNSQNN